MEDGPEAGTRWLGAPVRVGETEIGKVTAAVADAELERVLGLEVTGPHGSRMFLPWIAATLTGGVVHAHSTLVLFDAGEVDGYVRRGARLVHDPDDVRRLTALPRPDAGVSPHVPTGTRSP